MANTLERETTAAASKHDAAQHGDPGGPGHNEKGKWLALAAALLGWMFDGAEMGVFSLVGRPAVKDLMPGSTEGEVGLWFNVIMAGFLVGAATGGVLFGWLGDRIGRVRAMTISVLVYALFTGACGLAGQAWQVGVLRFIAALGMGGEWSLGVALVMEIWPNKSRAFMAGLIGAAANVGYMAVGFIGMGLLNVIASLENGLKAIHLPEDWVTMLVANSGWRVMMLMGTVPALLTFLIRMFVPESEKWEHENEKGTTNNWATQDLITVLVGILGPVLIVYIWAFDSTRGIEHGMALRIVATLVGLAIAVVGYTYPVVQYFRRQEAMHPERESTRRLTLGRMMLGACLSGVALLGTWGSTQQAPSWVDKTTEAKWQADKAELVAAGKADEAAKLERPKAKEHTLVWLSVGAIIGTILAALAGDWLGRRLSYFLLCVASLASAWYLFLGTDGYGTPFLFWTFVAGACTASFYGWLPLYLPELFRTNVRATGQGFSFNFGRILAAIGVLQVGNLLKLFDKDVIVGGWTIPHGHPLACSVICLVYLVGMVIIWFAPETRGKPLPE
ncbi:MAG: MFS transporter [Planctomycetes bacterium]|nr:MFS transporter [Planctomycetota bacterium]